MPWALLDVGFHDHPKVLALMDEPDALAALGLWTLCLAWAKGHADPGNPAVAGRIPTSLVRRLGGGDVHLGDLLVKAGLWEAAADGVWQIHDFAGWQQLEAWRVKRELGRKGGRPRKPRSEPSGNHMVHQPETIWPPIWPPMSQSHVMTGHEEDKKAEVVEPSVSRAANATRIPEDFPVTPGMVTWARTNVPHVDGRIETQKFIDHFKAASGANARKKDWIAAWRNWMRTADERRGRNGNGRPQGRQEILDDGFWER